VSEPNKTAADRLSLRAKLPRYFRAAAVALLAVTILAIGFGFYSSRNRSAFRLKSEHTRLSNEIVAEVNNYERLETDGDVPKYFVKADRATTFSDNHQELENVYLQVYDEQGVNSDKMTAAKALYVPEENKNFTAYLAGNIDIMTRDDLNVKTEQITYTKANETADSEEPVEFSRENVSGRATGARINIAEKRLELLSSVEIDTFNSSHDSREGHVTASAATFDQASQTIEFRQNVNATLVNADHNVDVSAGRAQVLLASADGSSPVLSTLKLYDSVLIRSSQKGAKPTRIDAGFAEYDKRADRFELKGGAKIDTVEGEQVTSISANEITYLQSNGKVSMNGDAQVSQKDALVKAAAIEAELNAERKMKNAVARGDAYLKQTAPDRVTEVSSSELNATFGDDQVLTLANAVGSSTAVLTPVNKVEYTLVRLEAPNAIHLWFKGAGLIDRMQTDGRTTIQLNVPDSGTDAANKKVTADTIHTFFDSAGKEIQKAEAIGNAVLFVEPLRVSAANYSTTVNAPRFDCDFFPGTSNARSCIAGTKAQGVRVPTQHDQGSGTQNISADKLTAVFSPTTKDVETFEASGNAKFTENDRNALASRFTYSPVEDIVHLRGGEPTAWDSRARAKAAEIDWNLRDQRSFLRGRVSTTYYNQRQTGGATPFSDSDRPVYITSDSAEFDHRQQTGKYTGNARGWQENNFVKANSLFIDQNGGKLTAEGSVQSLLYNARRRENGRETTVPVFASSQKMSYGRDVRIIRYENDVDIRQGTDRITGEVAQIYLNENNEVARSILENRVVITQPNRRAAGDYAEYVASDETVVLRGAPATVEDAENGSSSAAELRMYMRDNRVVSQGKTKAGSSGRIRSVYKVKNNP
jgi:LPS export ABC transporter protein LptC